MTTFVEPARRGQKIVRHKSPNSCKQGRQSAGTAGDVAASASCKGGRWGLFAPKPRTRVHWTLDPSLGLASDVAPGRPAKPAQGAQSAPGKYGNGRGENSFSPRPLPHFPLPRSLQTFLTNLADIVWILPAACRQSGCKGPCPLPQGTGAAEAPAPLRSRLRSSAFDEKNVKFFFPALFALRERDFSYIMKFTDWKGARHEAFA